jgi:hypothetical protein
MLGQAERWVRMTSATSKQRGLTKHHLPKRLLWAYISAIAIVLQEPYNNLMKIELFTFCDFAQENGGKLTIVGTFDTIVSRNFPCVHPQLSVVVGT